MRPSITKPLIFSCKMSDVPPLRDSGGGSDWSEDDRESNGSGETQHNVWKLWADQAHLDVVLVLHHSQQGQERQAGRPSVGIAVATPSSRQATTGYIDALYEEKSLSCLCGGRLVTRWCPRWRTSRCGFCDLQHRRLYKPCGSIESGPCEKPVFCDAWTSTDLSSLSWKNDAANSSSAEYRFVDVPDKRVMLPAFAECARPTVRPVSRSVSAIR